MGRFLDVGKVSETSRSKLQVNFNIYPKKKNISVSISGGISFYFFALSFYFFYLNAFLSRGECATILISVS